MEKISEMIKRMCPEGVELFQLGKISIISKGEKPSEIIECGDYKYINAGTVESGYCQYFNSKGNAVTTPSHGQGGIGYVGFQEKPFWCGALCYRLYEIPNISHVRYLYHILKKKSNVIKNFINEGGVPYYNQNKLEQLEIPLPPLPIQQEIVRILDSFTSMITNLETELASRQKQYEYYRNKLLTFDENDESVEWKTLGEIGTIVRGNGLQKTDFSEEGVGCVHYGQIYTRLGFSIDKTLTFVPEELAEKLTQVEPGNLIIACTSENVEDVCKSVVWLGTENIVTGGHACVFKHNESPKYVGYCFLTNDFFNQKKKYAYGAKVIDIKTEKLSLIKIPVPNRNIQDEIVEKLDTFESLITNIKQELEARKKQYEYYREQLLTFE